MIYKLILWGKDTRLAELSSALKVVTSSGEHRLRLVSAAKSRGSLTLTFTEEAP